MKISKKFDKDRDRDRNLNFRDRVHALEIIDVISTYDVSKKKMPKK